MRNLQKLFLFSLLVLPLSAGCEITTSSGEISDGGEGGATTNTTTPGGATSAATGGASATGGAQATAGSTTVATAGSTSTTPAYTAANCPASAAAAPPTWAADITAACIACIYDPAKTCTQAVACHNDATCASEVYAALECIELYNQYGAGVIMPEDLLACQSGDYVGVPPQAGYEAVAAVAKVQGLTPWYGAKVGTVGMTWLSALVDSCEAECHANVQ